MSLMKQYHSQVGMFYNIVDETNSICNLSVLFLNSAIRIFELCVNRNFLKTRKCSGKMISYMRKICCMCHSFNVNRVTLLLKAHRGSTEIYLLY
ncbi:hypothetical protein HanIR_Chr15g0758431 [Helianthus annuus]|nr:hypothetical protein HanIR_Chr15g0758431 [Helianthus annuus]